MAKTKKKTYTPAPTVPSDVEPRYRAVLEVMSGTTTVAEAARRLGMSRNHFQTLMHRSLEAMIQGLTPGQPGRPAKPEREVELEAERDKLLRKTEQLEQRLDMTTKLMGLASELIKGSTPRPRSTKQSPVVAAKSADDEGEEPPSSLRDLARRLDTLGLPRALVAGSFALAESTLRRWTTGGPPVPVVRRTDVPADVEAAMVRDIRELKGLPGADSLAKSHGVSRRQAAAVKLETLTAMERERRDGHSRVVVTAPGVIRGFDAMDRGHRCSPRFVLVAGDACVPFRTSVVCATRYDDDAVAAALAADFEENGPPLVVRFDRAKAHTAPKTTAILAAHRVLVLQGPPRHPQFYGQLERLNREHAAWVHDRHADDAVPFEDTIRGMRSALNVRWRRRALDWKTPEEAWNLRQPLTVDRDDLAARVRDHERRLRRDEPRANMTGDLAKRLAIEHVLANLGYLRIEIRRPLLGDKQVLKQAI